MSVSFAPTTVVGQLVIQGSIVVPLPHHKQAVVVVTGLRLPQLALHQILCFHPTLPVHVTSWIPRVISQQTIHQEDLLCLRRLRGLSWLRNPLPVFQIHRNIQAFHRPLPLQQLMNTSWSSKRGWDGKNNSSTTTMGSTLETCSEIKTNQSWPLHPKKTRRLNYWLKALLLRQRASLSHSK